MRIIINADDFGKSIKTNEAIEECIKKGLITSTTIMAGGDAFDDAVNRIKNFSNISVGVHLHIDECKSLTRNQCFQKNGMVDECGRFIYGSFNRYILTEELKEAIYQEWNAQIKYVINTGINVSHIDSHHHIHTYPELREVVSRVLDDNNIRKIRLSYVKPFGLKNESNINKDKQTKVTEHHRIIKSYHSIRRRIERICWNRSFKESYTTTDYFCPFLFFFLHKEWFEKKYSGKTLELMCHPGHPHYAKETELLFAVYSLNVMRMDYNHL